MAQIRLTAAEIIDGDYPPLCISCGRKARGLVTRKVSTLRAGFLCMIRTSLEIKIPVCREHRHASWIAWNRVEAKRIDEDGVILKHVSPRFIDALEDHRDYRHDETRRRQRRRRDRDADAIDLDSLERRRLRNYDDGDYDDDEYDDAPRRPSPNAGAGVGLTWASCLEFWE